MVVSIAYALDFVVQALKYQMISRVLATNLRIIEEELPRVVPLANHAEMLQHAAILFDEFLL